MGAVVAFAIFMIFGVGGLAILLEHFQKIAKIKADSNAAGNAQVADALDSIRREIGELRDTTTRYDLSFDSALQRLESRVAHLEDSARNKTASPAEQAVLKQGGA
jgi:hypothetical protein